MGLLKSAAPKYQHHLVTCFHSFPDMLLKSSVKSTEPLYVFTPATDTLGITWQSSKGEKCPIPIFAEVASVDSASLVMELRRAFGQWHPGRCSKLIAI